METPPAGNATLCCLDCPFCFYFVMFCFLRYQGWMQLSKLRLIWLFMIDQRLRSSELTLQSLFSLMGRKLGSLFCSLAIWEEALPYLYTPDWVLAPFPLASQFIPPTIKDAISPSTRVLLPFVILSFPSWPFILDFSALQKLPFLSLTFSAATSSHQICPTHIAEDLITFFFQLRLLHFPLSAFLSLPSPHVVYPFLSPRVISNSICDK